jgi:hypothetical protein
MATAKASEASASATTATTKAAEASASATAAQTAQAGAETAAQTAQAGADAVSLLREQIYNSYPNVEAETAPIVGITDGADGIPVKSLVVGIEPVQEGSGDPSPDNICPITGWTGANVQRTGKNLLPNLTGQRFAESIFIGQINRLTYPFHMQSGVTYCVSFVADGTSPLVYFKENGGTIQLWGASGSTYTPSKDMDVQLWIYAKGLTSVRDAQLELGSTATAYEPYQGTTYPITFPSEAGTVYGGQLDVTIIASYAGEALPGAWISDRDVYAEGVTPTTGAQIVYELATPITYQLTPTEVKTLLGSNSVWADTGNTSLAYRADPKLYIDGVYEDYQDDLADYADALAALG